GRAEVGGRDREAVDADAARLVLRHAALRRVADDGPLRTARTRHLRVLGRAPDVDRRWPDRDPRHERAVRDRAAGLARMRAASQRAHHQSLRADATRDAGAHPPLAPTVRRVVVAVCRAVVAAGEADVSDAGGQLDGREPALAAARARPQLLVL